MHSGKTLTSLALCLSFWIALVLLLLFSKGDLGDRAIATPIAASTVKQEKILPEVPVPEIPEPAVETTVPPLLEIRGEIGVGESLDRAMKRAGIDETLRREIISGFSKSLDFRVLQPGDRFTVHLDENDAMTQATYASGLLNIHVLSREADGSYLVVRQPVPLECRFERISGLIESSLYSTFMELGEDPKLIHAYADIFASKIDFNTETRSGDRFELLVEKYYRDAVFAGYGRILVARYEQEDGKFEGYYFTSDSTPPGHFDETGEALGTWFIRSPIPFGRVTSRFTMRRKHPIDGVVRPHLGVDLAAPAGTPVMATADGRVEFIGRKGGFGKTVILKHNGGYRTYYGHLSGYGKGLKNGALVSQKDIIGYVGSTGISTGPHLDYRIQQNGVFRNPFAIKFQAKTILQDEELDRFRLESRQTAELFNRPGSERILQVKNVILSDEHSISFL